MTKNREETEKKILNAVQKVLIEDGAANLGVNTIARKAGVSKVLIYRYFDSYNALIIKYIEQNNPFPQIRKKSLKYIKDENPKLEDAVIYFFSELIDYVYDNPSFREILIWEMAFSNDITKEIAKHREESSIEIFKSIYEYYPQIDKGKFPGITSILTGGIFYLTARSNTVDKFSGFDIKESREYLKSSIKSLIYGVISNY